MALPDLNVVTAVDPQKKDVEFNPTDIIEIVFTDRMNVSWKFVEADQWCKLGIKMLRDEVYIHDGFERFRRNSVFQITPWTNRLGTRQQHWWFRLSPNESAVVFNQTENKKKIGTLVFFDERACISKVDLILVVNDDSKAKYFNFLENTFFRSQDPLLKEANYIGLGGRYKDEEKGYILNPAIDENVVFELTQRKMLIEIADPPGLAKGSKYLPIGSKSCKGDANFEMKGLIPRSINGRPLHRILIENSLYNLPAGIEKMRLGVLKLRAMDADNMFCPRLDRTVNFWITRQREIGADYSDDDFEAENEIYEQICTVVRESESKSGRMRSKVVIEELKESLTTGVKLIKVFRPEPTILREIEIVDPANNTTISLDEDEELVIHLYKDTSKFSKEAIEWKLERSGVLLNHYLISDSHRQKFYFKIKKESNYWGESLTFVKGGRQLIINVKKPTLISYPDYDCED